MASIVIADWLAPEQLSLNPIKEGLTIPQSLIQYVDPNRRETALLLYADFTTGNVSGEPIIYEDRLADLEERKLSFDDLWSEPWRLGGKGRVYSHLESVEAVIAGAEWVSTGLVSLDDVLVHELEQLVAELKQSDMERFAHFIIS